MKVSSETTLREFGEMLEKLEVSHVLGAIYDGQVMIRLVVDRQDYVGVASMGSGIACAVHEAVRKVEQAKGVDTNAL